ncbi:MAG: hypothetical protein JEZ00_05490 [Anaerolineaceae bacterium]|nr:hypothetical protein [Anaerolineaceae bacterium]
MQIFSKKPNNTQVKNTRQLPIVGNLLIAFGLITGAFVFGKSLYQQGAHTLVKYVLQGRVEELPDGAIKEALIEASGLITSETYAYQQNDLSTLYLDIPFENTQVIQQKRDEAVETGVLLASDEDYVSATVRYDDSAPMDVKLRLKGDWTDHLEGQKWSYRIHIQDDSAIEGMRRFSIQAPETRAFVYEWAYHQTLMKEGLLAPRYFFINVIENGEYKGIYAMEESFYTELMESQQRRSGVILRYDEDDMWQNWAAFFSVGKEDLRTSAGSSGYFMESDFLAANISGFGKTKILSDQVLEDEYRIAQEMLRGYQSGGLNASDVFDMEQMGKFFAITELWGAGHSLAWHNLRFYYNPVTNLLEPIGFDGLPMTEPFVAVNFNAINTEDFLFNDPEIRKAIYLFIHDYLEDGYLESLRDELFQEAGDYTDALNKNYFIDTTINWEKLNVQRDHLREQLDPINYLTIYLDASAEEADVTNLNIANTYMVPLEISGIEIRHDDRVIQKFHLDSELPCMLPGESQFTTIGLPLSLNLDSIALDEQMIYIELFEPQKMNKTFWISVSDIN